jgi:hypothetical protein
MDAVRDEAHLYSNVGPRGELVLLAIRWPCQSKDGRINVRRKIRR